MNNQTCKIILNHDVLDNAFSTYKRAEKIYYDLRFQNYDIQAKEEASQNIFIYWIYPVYPCKMVSI